MVDEMFGPGNDVHSIGRSGLSKEQAVTVQRLLKASVRVCPLPEQPRKVAGADVAYLRNGKECFASIVILEGGTGAVIEQAVVRKPVPYPYIPGLLAFRELPPIVHAVSQLQMAPELVFVDGHGILHPRGLGLASHLGILLDIPTIGCAKRPPFPILVFEERPRAKRGSYSTVSMTVDQPAGVILHTRTHSKPLYVSPGHMITLQESIQWTLRTTGRYRLPEPIRRAHQLASLLRNEAESRCGWE